VITIKDDGVMKMPISKIVIVQSRGRCDHYVYADLSYLVLPFLSGYPALCGCFLAVCLSYSFTSAVSYLQ
jgi:hypothetical protein